VILLEFNFKGSVERLDTENIPDRPVCRKDSTGNGLFTMSRLGPEELTHKAVEGYLSKGRQMQSAYVAELLSRLLRLIGAGLIRALGRVGAIPARKRCRDIRISESSDFYY
jgi:hypothetical protein